MVNTQNIIKEKYESIKQSGLNSLFIHPDRVYSLIDDLINAYPDNQSHVKINQVGSSFLEKPIYKVTLGSGSINIFLWSQMHGDESTATASLFDLINYTLSPENTEWFDSWRDKITLHIVPMLNPDGAELEQRVNAQSIDINRDAKALQTPEGRLLLSLAEEINPVFGFNLHSQNRFYTVGNTNNSAVISLLAPAYNDSNETNDSRKKAKQLISVINQAIQVQYPHHVGRYDDTYSYRSFGDLFSAKGIATILIEAGYYKDDQTRQIPRWLTFLSIVESINAINEQSFTKESLDNYDAIPFNNEDGLVDLLLTKVLINDDYQVDISINYDDFFKNGSVDSIGDLSTISGMCSIDMQSYKMESIKGYPLNQTLTLTMETYINLLNDGYGYFVGDESLLNNHTNLPVIFSHQEVNCSARLNQPANFLFSKNGKMALVILNGIVINLENITSE
ncbi:MAG: peptidase M14 [Kangiella sp.]|nr:MAG: peptidase M14 [Kangiella sp.]